MQIIPMSELKNTTGIERRCAEENGPIYVTKNGYGKLVIMTMEVYENMFRQLYEAKCVNRGLADVEAGRITDSKIVMEEIKQKYGF